MLLHLRLFSNAQTFMSNLLLSHALFLTSYISEPLDRNLDAKQKIQNRHQQINNNIVITKTYWSPPKS